MDETKQGRDGKRSVGMEESREKIQKGREDKGEKEVKQMR